MSMIGGTTIPPKFHGEVQHHKDSELRAKHEKGLFYRCDNKWSSRHRCKWRDLNVLVTYDAKDVKDGDWEHQKEPKASLDKAEIIKSSEVSLNSDVGLTTPKPMKIRGFFRRSGNGHSHRPWSHAQLHLQRSCAKIKVTCNQDYGIWNHYEYKGLRH